MPPFVPPPRANIMLTADHLESTDRNIQPAGTGSANINLVCKHSAAFPAQGMHRVRSLHGRLTNLAKALVTAAGVCRPLGCLATASKEQQRTASLLGSVYPAHTPSLLPRGLLLLLLPCPLLLWWLLLLWLLLPTTSLAARLLLAPLLLLPTILPVRLAWASLLLLPPATLSALLLLAPLLLLLLAPTTPATVASSSATPAPLRIPPTPSITPPALLLLLLGLVGRLRGTPIIPLLALRVPPTAPPTAAPAAPGLPSCAKLPVTVRPAPAPAPAATTPKATVTKPCNSTHQAGRQAAGSSSHQQNEDMVHRRWMPQT